MAWGGAHHTTLVIASLEATTHLVDFPQALLTSSEPHEVSLMPGVYMLQELLNCVQDDTCGKS